MHYNPTKRFQFGYLGMKASNSIHASKTPQQGEMAEKELSFGTQVHLCLGQNLEVESPRSAKRNKKSHKHI